MIGKSFIAFTSTRLFIVIMLVAGSMSYIKTKSPLSKAFEKARQVYQGNLNNVYGNPNKHGIMAKGGVSVTAMQRKERNPTLLQKSLFMEKMMDVMKKNMIKAKLQEIMKRKENRKAKHAGLGYSDLTKEETKQIEEKQRAKKIDSFFKGLLTPKKGVNSIENSNQFKLRPLDQDFGFIQERPVRVAKGVYIAKIKDTLISKPKRHKKRDQNRIVLNKQDSGRGKEEIHYKKAEKPKLNDDPFAEFRDLDSDFKKIDKQMGDLARMANDYSAKFQTNLHYRKTKKDHKTVSDYEA